MSRVLLREREAAAFAAGRKSMLLRPVTPQPVAYRPAVDNPEWTEHAGKPWMPEGGVHQDQWRCPLGAPGDELWGAEAFALSIADPDRMEPDRRNPDDWDAPVYRVDTPHGEWTGEKGKRIAPPWEPSCRMPRWASRFSWRVTDVRVVRVQDVTEAEARACGVGPLQMDEGMFLPRLEGLWNADDGKLHPWDANPWVWLVSVEAAR